MFVSDTHPKVVTRHETTGDQISVLTLGRKESSLHRHVPGLPPEPRGEPRWWRTLHLDSRKYRVKGVDLLSPFPLFLEGNVPLAPKVLLDTHDVHVPWFICGRE